MRHSNIIELNGKQYDANSGVLVGERLVLATSVARSTYAGGSQGRSVDGFVRAPSKTTDDISTPPIKKPAAKPASHLDLTKARPQHHVKAHTPERAHTLMRRAVMKPKPALKPAIRTIGSSGIAPKTAASLAVPLEKKVSVFQINPVRLAHASHIHKSHHIQHFNAQSGFEAPSAAQPLASHAVGVRPLAQGAAPLSHSESLQRAHLQLASKKTAAALFENALTKATSHEQPEHPQQGRKAARHRRMVNALAGIAAFMVIGGFVTYLNMPAIELNVASMRAGFHAAAPGYQPEGYSLANGVRASKGKIEMTYRSGDSAYKITQIASDWNSATLLDQNLEQRGAPTKTVQSKGRIIYIYGDNATWVNGGVVYDVSGDASLDTDQLVSLATSM